MQNATLSQPRAHAAENSKLRRFFVESLQDIYYAEKHLVDALETLQEKATSAELKNAFASHRGETENHVTRLEQAFNILGEEAEEKKCYAIKGIISEANSIIDDTENDTLTRDAALILAGQKAEHYEIGTYGTLIQFANVLGEDEVSQMLQQTLNEEKKADETLTQIAESVINENAVKEVDE